MNTSSSGLFPVVAPRPTAVVAMGGHAFIQPGERGTYEDHTRNARAICRELMTLVERDYNLVITHGNGPQVGDALRAAELTKDVVPSLPLDALVAQTAGTLGYFLQRALLNELHAQGIDRKVVTMITQVLVDPDDEAFAKPTKPIGPFMGEAEATDAANRLGWQIVEQKGRGFRRVVPSPRPVEILQREMLRGAVQGGNIIIACGGGGIPVCIDREHATEDYVGVEAVIDKDLTSGVLASDVGADLLVILTAVDAVYLDFAGENPRRLGAITLADADAHVAAGHFPVGSMGPKVAAIRDYLARGGRRGLVTDAAHLRAALDGRAGTHFIGRI
jgi:carbamate kinase